MHKSDMVEASIGLKHEMGQGQLEPLLPCEFFKDASNE